MTDRFGRSINYMRVSITDRCNLRCRYCMPKGAEPLTHGDILRYEEILRVCSQAAKLGISRFKITGGEPLVRKGCPGLVRALKELDGVEQVTLTTNGLLLPPVLDELVDGGLDGVNISLDTLDDAAYAGLTGFDGGTPVKNLLETLDACLERGLRTKVNAVLLDETRPFWEGLAALAGRGADVRLIELMPIGAGAAFPPVSAGEALAVLRRAWPDLRPVDERRGNGPARYFASRALKGRIGLIDAVSHKFCSACNRVRLTSTGLFKPCLCYDAGTDLRAILRRGGSGEELRAEMERAVFEKPPAHCFEEARQITERKMMSQIGG